MNHQKIRRSLGVTAVVASLAATSLTVGAATAFANEGDAAAPATDTGKKGTVVMIGGAISPNDTEYSSRIMDEIVRLAQEHAGEGKRPLIAVSTAASTPAANAEEAADEDEDNATINGMVYYKEWFERHGADVYPIPVDVNPGLDYPGDPYSADNANDPDVAAAIAAADGVFFGGGDQTNYVRAFMDCTGPDAAAEAIHAYTTCTDTPAMAAIRSVVDSGGVTGGTSAGLAIQQGKDMISGGSLYQSWAEGARPGWYSGDDPEIGDPLTYIPAGGFGFFDEGTMDSHFARRDRQPRVIRLAIETGHDLAFGVEEKTALIVDRASRTGRVMGELGATMLDVSDAVSDGQNVSGVRYSYFGDGSTIDFASRKISLAGDVKTGPGTATIPADWAQEDIWGSGDCNDGIFGTMSVVEQLVPSTESRLSGITCDAGDGEPRFVTTLNRTADTQWTDTGSFTDLEITIANEAALQVSPVTNLAAVVAGQESELAFTVTNTGGTGVNGVTLGGALAPAHDLASMANEVLLPGQSVTVSTPYTAKLGAQEFAVAVTATPTTTAGAPLNADDATYAQTFSVTGVKNSTDGGTDGGTDTGTTPGTGANGTTGNGAADASKDGALAHTGADASSAWSYGIAGLALVLAGAAATIFGRRSRTQR